MKVRDLINYLKSFDPNLPVILPIGGTDNFYEVSHVEGAVLVNEDGISEFGTRYCDTYMIKEDYEANFGGDSSAAAYASNAIAIFADEN